MRIDLAGLRFSPSTVASHTCFTFSCSMSSKLSDPYLSRDSVASLRSTQSLIACCLNCPSWNSFVTDRRISIDLLDSVKKYGKFLGTNAL